MNQSAQLFSRARSVIPGGVNSPVRAFRNVDGDPFFVQSAKGAYITDADGRQLIDYIGTWGRPFWATLRNPFWTQYMPPWTGGWAMEFLRRRKWIWRK